MVNIEAACAVFQEEIVLPKWRLLILACFLTFGSYYVYDFPGSIGMGHDGSVEAAFFFKGLPYTNEMNQALYSVYSWPNTVLAVFGGLLIDKYLGLRKAMMLFASLVMLGSIVFWIGVLSINYPLMVVGRVIFGLGGESLSVSQSSMTARWFRGGRGMALAMGITVSFSRVGSSVNFFASPVIAERLGVHWAALIGALCCVFSFLAGIGIVLFDKYGVSQGVVPEESKDSNSTLNLKDAFKLPLTFWLTCLICAFVYDAIFPFTSVAKNFFEVKFNVSGPTGSSYTALYQISSAAGSPLVGGLVDGMGRFSQFMGGSSIGFMLIHLLFIFTAAPAYVMMPLMGVSYSFLVSSLWPCVPYAVPETLCGLAYGIMTAMQNTGLAIVPLISGAILDANTPPMPYIGPANCSDKLPPSMDKWPPMTRVNCTNVTAPLPTQKGFEDAIFLFFTMAVCSLITSIGLYVADLRHTGGALSSSPVKRKELMAKLAAEQESLVVNEDNNHGAKIVEEGVGVHHHEHDTTAQKAHGRAVDQV